MKTTYPIYEARFLGSSDCMCHTMVRVAALNKRDAAKKLLSIQRDRAFNLGKIGYYSQEHKAWVTNETAISLVKDTRATTLSYRHSNYNP